MSDDTQNGIESAPAANTAPNNTDALASQQEQPPRTATGAETPAAAVPQPNTTSRTRKSSSSEVRR